MRDHLLTVSFDFPIVDGYVQIAEGLTMEHKWFERILNSQAFKAIFIETLYRYYLKGDSNEQNANLN